MNREHELEQEYKKIIDIMIYNCKECSKSNAHIEIGCTQHIKEKAQIEARLDELRRRNAEINKVTKEEIKRVTKSTFYDGEVKNAITYHLVNLLTALGLSEDKNGM